MIVKILNDFKDLKNILESISMKYQLMYYSNALYLYSDDKSITQEKIQKDIKKIIKSSFYLVEIDENNLKYEPNNVVEWCKGKFIEYEAKLFEEDKQQELQAMLKFVEDFDKKVAELIHEKQQIN